MKLFIKIFFITSFLFGLSMAVLYSFKVGLIGGVIVGILCGLIFGVLLTSIVMLVQFITIKFLKIKSLKIDVSPCQNRTILINASFDDAYQTCNLALENLRDAIIENKDSVSGKIEASTQRTWKSWGEKILISLSKCDEKKTRIEILSKPVYTPTMLDYGKGYLNVESILSDIKNRNEEVSR